MSCSPFDLRDYFLKELERPQQLEVEAHVRNCAACREELERLSAAEAALFSLRDEEIPQRIAFVSDQIFEPSAVRRWLTAFWSSTPRLGFASAAMLSAALVFFALYHPPAPASGAATAVRAVADQPWAMTAEQVDQRVQAAVAKAVAEVEARQSAESRRQLAEFRQAADEARAKLILAGNELEKTQRRYQLLRTTAMVRGPEEPGEVK